jgi:type I restriction enzyme S subunit
VNWVEHKLGEFISIKHGWAFKGKFFAEDGKYLLLTPGNIHETGGLKLRPGKEKFYTGEFPDEFLMKAGDMLVVMTDLIQAAPILGGAIVVPEDGRYLHNQRLGLVEYLPDRTIDKTFLYYVLNSPMYRGQVRSSATGATVRHTAPKRIYECTVLMPDLVEEQQQVGAVLAAYDDLITANQRRIVLLEDAARRLYREWFAHLRFPGHETVRVVDGVPQGWQRKNLFDVADVDYGFPFKAGQFNNNGVGMPVVRIRDIPDVSTSTYTTEEVDNSYIIERGDFLIGMDGIFHMNYWVGCNAYLVQRVCRVRPREELLRAYIGLALLAPIKEFEISIQGATVAHLGAKHLKQIKLLIPCKLEEKLEMLNSMLWQTITLREENIQLARARDLLLPKLMSGQLDVSGVALPEEAAA